MIRKALPLVLAIAVIAGVFAYKSYNRVAEEMTDRSTEISISAQQLLDEFSTDESIANAAYLDKVIEVQGIIGQVEDNEESQSIYLETSDMMSSVICELEKGQPHAGLEVGQKIKMKGQCSGYLMDVVLVRCVVAE